MSVVSLMESHENLQTLIERAWALHDRVTDEIKNSRCSRGFCSEHGYYGGFAEAPFVERERLIATGDALKAVENMLMFLQRLLSRHQIEQNVALTRLEESRLLLIKRVTEHRGRTLNVIQEMLALFGDENNTVNKNSNDPTAMKGKPNVYAGGSRKGIASFLFSYLQILLNPWKWNKAARVAIRYVVASASIISLIQFHQTRQQISNSWKIKEHLLLDSMKEGKEVFLYPLDVLYGRG